MRQFQSDTLGAMEEYRDLRLNLAKAGLASMKCAILGGVFDISKKSAD
jgi:hypothetical protein